MNWRQKLTKLLSLIFIAIAVAACKGEGCIEPDEFDNDYIQVDSNPTDDGIFGSYDHVNGGQTAEWHQTGLTSNGEGFLIHVSGSWAPWYGSMMTQKKLNQLKRCEFCAKRRDDPNESCICYKNQKPLKKENYGIEPFQECDIESLNNDATQCTCTTKNGKVTDYGVFHFPLTYYADDHHIKLPDEQHDPCKYDRGMGLYIGLFGNSGNQMPIRVYHLFSEEEICPITLNSDGQCIDENGINRTKYVFRSANNRIFIKDDLAGNDGTDTNAGDDIFHKPNEHVKFIIHDRYYSDNYGSYNISILKGVWRDGDTGLLEFLVKMVEDSLLGKIDKNGQRQGSVIEFMYKAVVQDMYFGAILQMCLVLYIAFYGIAVLIGIAEINKKQIYGRVLKVGLIILFTTASSWNFYNQIIVGFFKDSMDFLINFVTNFAESNIDENNPLRVAQMAAESQTGSSSRFAYIDNMIKTLFSLNVTKKIWGLFFTGGILYIILIYVLIFGFLYVMLLAASIYIVTLMKLIFVLALGPIFIAFTLFGQTLESFKKWLAFLGARSLEIIILFLLLYTFVMIIDRRFVELLSYRVCWETIIFGIFPLNILKSHSDRSFVSWMHDISTIAGLLFMTYLVIQQIPTLSGGLISIGGNDGGGVDDGGHNKQSLSTNSIAGKFMSNIGTLATGSLSIATKDILAPSFRVGRYVTRKMGISGAIDSIGEKIPFRGPRTILRDMMIDEAIKRAKKAALAKGLTAGTKEFDKEVRSHFYKNSVDGGMQAWMFQNKNKSAFLDMTEKNISARLEKKLVKEPLKKFIKDRAKAIKRMDPKDIPLGKDMNQKLKEDARQWAEKSLIGGAASINGHLHDLKGFLTQKGSLSSTEAAKLFASNQSLKDRYLEHLKDKELKHRGNALQRAFRLDPHSKQQNFVRRVNYQEKQNNANFGTLGSIVSQMGVDPNKKAHQRVNLLDVRNFKDTTETSVASMARDYLVNGRTALDKEDLKNYYNKKLTDHQNDNYGALLRQKREKKLSEIDKKREDYKKIFADQITREARSKKDDHEYRDNARAKYEALLQRHLEAQKEAINNPDMVRKMGGYEALRDGMISFDGETLFEAKTRYEALGFGASTAGTLMDQGPQDQTLKQHHDTVLAQMQAEKENFARQAEETECLLAAQQMAEAKIAFEAMQNPDDMFQFGSSIEKALVVQSSSITPEASNILLGQSQTKIDTTDYAMIMNCESEKSRADSLARMKKFEKAFKEHELNAAEDANEKRRLSQEISSLDSEISNAERKSEAIAQQINNLKQAQPS